jgi:oxaloacetate decarboxylase alpha subunit
MTYLKAIEAGVDIVDTAVSPLSSGTSQPATESLALALQGNRRDPKLKMQYLNSIADYFKPIMKKYEESGIYNIKVLQTEPRTLQYQVPGGMLSNLISQMKSLNASDTFDEVLAEVPRVREDLGFPPLVTPMSQMIGSQAVFNVISGERYKIVPTEIKNYIKGLYGAPPAPINEEIKKILAGDDNIIDVRPADLLEDEYDKMKNEIGELAESTEDILSYALFPQVAKEYLERRRFDQYSNAEVGII